MIAADIVDNLLMYSFSPLCKVFVCRLSFFLCLFFCWYFLLFSPSSLSFPSCSRSCFNIDRV